VAALTQEQTNRRNELETKAELTPEEKKELNVLQKVHSGQDTDADNPGGDNNPENFDSEKNPNEQSLSEKDLRQRESAQSK
jgi:hypothetical protein